MTHPKTPFRGFKRPKGVRGTSGRPVNIDFRFQHMFLRIDALIRNLFQGGARYPLLPTRLSVVVDVYVVDFKPLGFEFIQGINGISALGGVTILHSRVN